MNALEICDFTQTKPVILNIYQRINGVMSEAKYIEKEKKQVNGQYRFASHDAVTSKLNPLFVKYGIVVVPDVVEMLQEGNRTTCKLQVTFLNMDSPSDKFCVTYYGYGLDNQDKGPGKAISYAFKYAMLKTFCLETGDDPETDAKTEFKPDSPQASAPVKEKEPPTKVIKDMFNEILANYDVEEHEDVKKFFRSYCEVNKKTQYQALTHYADPDKFDASFKNWQTKQRKMKNDSSL